MSLKPDIIPRELGTGKIVAYVYMCQVCNERIEDHSKDENWNPPGWLKNITWGGNICLKCSSHTERLMLETASFLKICNKYLKKQDFKRVCTCECFIPHEEISAQYSYNPEGVKHLVCNSWVEWRNS